MSRSRDRRRRAERRGEHVVSLTIAADVEELARAGEKAAAAIRDIVGYRVTPELLASESVTTHHRSDDLALARALAANGQHDWADHLREIADAREPELTRQGRGG